MKIGIDASILARKKITGTNRFLRNLLEYIPELDKKNEYFLFAPCKLEEYKNRGFNVISIGENRILSPKYYFPIWLNFVLPRALKKFQPDIFFQPNNFLPLFISDKRTKFITTIYDPIPQMAPQYRGLIYKTYLNILLPPSIEKSRTIVTVSENTKKDIVKFYHVPPEKIYVVYLAADEKFRPRDLAKKQKNELLLKYNLPEKFILHIGAIEDRKNIIGILKIGDLLEKAGNDIKIVLIGKPGFGSTELFKQIKKRDNIFYLGHIKDKDLPYLYKASVQFCSQLF